jgi:hypothetical protein
MSRDDQINSALDSIVQESGTKSNKENDPHVQIHNLLEKMTEDEINRVKRQVDHLIEKKHGERKRTQERVKFNSQREDNMFDGLL